jgi:Zn-dependent protease
MIQFRLFGLPVSIHWMFWLVVIMISGRLQMSGKVGEIYALIAWLLAGFVSIMWHELGHAFFQKKFGARPEIILHQMGGVSIGHGGYFTRWQSLTISLMGPIFGLLLWALIFFITLSVDVKELSLGAKIFIDDMLWINLAWSIFNLMPIYPLDGGQAFMVLSNGRTKIVAIVGMIVAGILAVWAMNTGSIWNTLLCGYLAYQNYLMWKEPYHRPNFY